VIDEKRFLIHERELDEVEIIKISRYCFVFYRGVRVGGEGESGGQVCVVVDIVSSTIRPLEIRGFMVRRIEQPLLALC